jgi:hypothetical protein
MGTPIESGAHSPSIARLTWCGVCCYAFWMIVKVQLSEFSSANAPKVLIYDETRSFRYEGGINSDMVEAMGGRAGVFFEAEVGEGGLEIGVEVADPGW